MLNFLILILNSVTSQSGFGCNKYFCPEIFVGDNNCDSSCMNKDCNFDSPLYSDDKYLTFKSSDCYSSCDCGEVQLTNGICDPECDKIGCGFDLGDCGYCDSGCFLEDLESGICKVECSGFFCRKYVSNECLNTLCAPKCPIKNLGSTLCQRMCYNSECLYDKGDCDCSEGCFDTSGDCLTTQNFTDPCDTESCAYKDRKCGFCASGCFEEELGDGICQPECNNKYCNYDNGDCGCAPGCSFYYNASISNYTQTGSSENCSRNCLVLECRFGIDFCTNETLIKSAVLNSLILNSKQLWYFIDYCEYLNCAIEETMVYVDWTDSCSESSNCNNQYCYYCVGRANKTFEGCLRQSFNHCLICDSTMVEGNCYRDLNECPSGYIDVEKLANLFGNSHWCLKEHNNYSKSNYKEIYVNSSAILNGNGNKDSPFKSLYRALINIYAAFSKIYLVNEEIEFGIDGSSSIFVDDKLDPLNSKTKYESFELWIIGNYSETRKTKVYWKDNLKITPLAQKFFMKNIEFIGKYTMNNFCAHETCFYCPKVSFKGILGYNDKGNLVGYFDYTQNYSKNCYEYSSVDVFNFSSKEVLIENVNFAEFRYQFNSFIRSSGVLSLKNVNFYKMQAKSTGSIIQLNCIHDCVDDYQCINDCTGSEFTYTQGTVSGLGAGYDDTVSVATGSFLISLGMMKISISNVKFSYNFSFNSLKSTDMAYLIYSKNHLGTILIEDCAFSNNYVNYLVYIDVSNLVYPDYKVDKGTSVAYSQQHFFMNKIEISQTYCSHGMISYLMSEIVHNIKVKNLFVKESVVGSEGILVFHNSGKLKEQDINGEYKHFPDFDIQYYIYIESRLLLLENIVIANSSIGENALYIQNLPNCDIKNISINHIVDGTVDNIQTIIDSFNQSDSNRYFSFIDTETELPLLNCNELVKIINSVNLKINLMLISHITCIIEEATLGLYLNKITGTTTILGLDLTYMESKARLSTAVKVSNCNTTIIANLKLFNILNLQESIVDFDNCNEIIIDSVQIYQVKSFYSSTFIVTNSRSFTLTNFWFNDMSSEYSNGGCLFLMTGSDSSSYTIQSGNFSGCSSVNAEGGAIYLDSLTRVYETSFKMNDVMISNSSSYEGSAIFISKNVIFRDANDSEIINLCIKDNNCKGGGAVSDYHFLGTLAVDGLEMVNNNRGLYVFYSNNYPELFISNTKFYASSIQFSVVYLNSLMFGSSVNFRNVEFYDANILTIEANNFKIFIDQVNIFNSYQVIHLSEKVECTANKLRINNTMDKAISISKQSSFYCFDCDFNNNFNFIIEASANSNFSLVSSRIFSNVLSSEYIFSVFSGTNRESSLIDCQIKSNSLMSGSLIYLFSSIFTLRNCSIVENHGYSDKVQVIYSYDSILNIHDSKLQFNGFVEYGAFFYAVAGSSVNATNTFFENSESYIGNIYGSSVNITINNCTFSGNTGGDVYTVKSNLIISKSIFQNSLLNYSYTGVIGMISNYNTLIEESVIRNVLTTANLSSLSYIYDQSSKKVEISNCHLTGTRFLQMAVYLKGSTSVIIKNSLFHKFETKEYSALTAISKENGCELIVINSKLTENLSDSCGGGLYSENYNLIVESTEISFNSAHDSGGGVYFTSSKCDECLFHLIGDSKIFNNSCKNDGGGIKWKNSMPYIEDTVLFYNNSAVYGLDIASTPAKFGFLQNKKLSTNFIETILDVAPGKKITDVILVSIFDTYGQVVKTENSITATLIVNETIDSVVAISGITSFKAEKGILYIKDFTLTGMPGSSAYLRLYSENMKSTVGINYKSEYSDSAVIKVEFRNCTNGEQIQAVACVDCFGGKYTLKASENCLDCPIGAYCTGGDAIIVKNGYWRSSLESEVVYACDVFEACLKGNETNQLGYCSKGYSGVLCKSCVLGYSKTAEGMCTKCPDKEKNFVTIALLCLAIHLISFVMVKTSLTSAFSPKSLHSIYIKIFTNYLQLVFIVTQFDLNWPFYVIEFFNVQRIPATVVDQLFSLDCLIALRDSVDVKNIYYTKLYLISSLPIVIVAVSYCYWIFHSGILESYKCLKREAYTTIIVLFFLVYPTIIKFMFSNFSCIEIDKMKSYLSENTSIECWDLEHKKFSFVVVIPSIILWAIGVPTILLILMTKNKRRLHLDYYRVVFGFLFNGYKQNRYYWEINIMYRKILLITLSVFNISNAQIIQALNFILVLLGSIYLHHSFKPYNSNQLNNMEMQALNIAAITIYFGLYYLSKSINKPIKIILFILIIFGNSYFILYWTYYITTALFDIFIKVFPRFRSILKRGDAFEEEFNREEIVREGVYFNRLDGKKAYTFINLERKIETDGINYSCIEDAYIDVAKSEIKRLEFS